MKIPDGVTAIGALAFDGTILTSVQLPSGLTTIGHEAFRFTDMTNLVIPASVTDIDLSAFSDCENLKNVYFYGDFPGESSSVFGNNGVTFYYLPGTNGWTTENMKKLVGSAYTYTLKKWADDSGICGENVTWKLDSNGVLTISGSGAMTDYNETDSGYEMPWKSLKDGILKVVITDGVTSIGDEAFFECTNLTEVKIGNSVANIGNFAFGFCVALTEVTIPKSVATVEENAFRDCGLTEILFMGNCPTVGSYAFAIPPYEDTVTVKYHEGSTGWSNASIRSIGDVPTATGYDRFIYEFSMQAHSWQSPVHTKNATCTSLAERTYTCSVCKNTKKETYGSRNAHTAGSWITTKKATCTAGGTKIQKCTACGVQLKTQAIKASGHSFGNWVVTAEATVFEAQKEKRTCKTCGAAETRTTGSALKPTMEVNVTSIPLKVGQSTKVVKVTGLQKE